jgi:hypothetical protein
LSAVLGFVTFSVIFMGGGVAFVVIVIIEGLREDRAVTWQSSCHLV